MAKLWGKAEASAGGTFHLTWALTSHCAAAHLQRQAEAVSGEHVLAAVLANALYGAAIGSGMLAEGHMLEDSYGS